MAATATAPHPPPQAKPLLRAASASGAPMELRRFLAPTMAECLSRVKTELGAGAVILSTRTVHEKRWMGLLRREQIEITAGRGMRTMPRRPAVRTQEQPQAPAVHPGRHLLNTPAAMGAAYMGVSQEIDGLKKVVGDLVTQFRCSQAPDIPAAFLECYRAMRDQQVADPMAREIIASAAAATSQHLVDPAEVRRLVCDEIQKRLRIGGALVKTALDRPHVVALIGPTGVGKTTTIAKLAANLKLRENRRVGLITIDTYRIAAIDQLKKYAQIISAPLCVVSHPEEIRGAVEQMGDCDFILIDTAGRSPKDAPKLRELRAFLEAARPDEVHLVLSTVCGTQSTELALERFSGVRADRLIFTKLDEAAEVGLVLNVAARTRLPLSYLTHGQDVPNDIDVASAARLAQMMTEAPAGQLATA